MYGPGLKAGVRVGDRIDVRRNNYLWQVYEPGQPLRFTVLRGEVAVPITVIPVQSPVTWDELLRFFSVFWLLAFAAMIAARSTHTKGSALLALTLVLIAIESPLGRSNLPWWLPFLAINVLSTLGWFLTFVVLAVFAANFAPPLSRARRSMTLLTFAFAALCAALACTAQVAGFTTWFDPDVGFLKYYHVIGVLPVITCALCGAFAFHASSGADKQRIAWIFSSFGFFWTTWFINTIGHTRTSLVALENAALLVVPLALTYAALSRRLFDTGFVLNRAAVVGGVSLIFVGAFVLLEWALGKWFENASRTTSLTVNVMLALGLGISLRFIHRRVDRFVDTVFFKKRHSDETALRRFAREAAFITDRQTLIDRTHTEVLDHSDAPSVSVLLLEGGHYALARGSADGMVPVDINDPAILAMRTWHDALDLHNYSTAIAGEFAFPMLSHGTLIGVLACGAKKSGEAYAPDEIDSFRTLAHGVGVSLDSLNKDNSVNNASLRETIIAMQDTIISELRALPSKIKR